MTRFPSDGDGGKIYIPFHRPFRLRQLIKLYPSFFYRILVLLSSSFSGPNKWFLPWIWPFFLFFFFFCWTERELRVNESGTDTHLHLSLPFILSLCWSYSTDISIRKTRKEKLMQRSCISFYYALIYARTRSSLWFCFAVFEEKKPSIHEDEEKRKFYLWSSLLVIFLDLIFSPHLRWWLEERSEKKWGKEVRGKTWRPKNRKTSQGRESLSFEDISHVFQISSQLFC